MAKEKLSKRLSLCEAKADKINKTNLTQKQIMDDLLHIWETAYEEGYQDHALDCKKLKGSRESLLLQGFNMMRDAIDNKIHECK
jgi:hypothetical protein